MTQRAIGIDVGGSTIKAARVDRCGALDGLIKTPTPADAGDIADLCGRLAAELAFGDVVAAGVGSAGFVDRETGVHIWGPHVAGPAPLVEAMLRATGLPAIIDNDANAAAFAELRIGAAKGHSQVLVVMLGTGIGGGLIVDGSVYRGSGFAGEIGHFIVDPAGPPCACGRNGCWETFVSGRVLDAAAVQLAHADPGGAIAAASAGQTPTGENLMQAARAGDPGALDAWAQAGEWLGRGVAQLAAVLDPEVVVVGGAPSQAGDLLLDRARETLAEVRHGSGYSKVIPVVASRFGANSAVIGAALQALESFDD